MTPPFLTPLDGPALRALDIPPPWALGMASRVRFHEIDALGHVNNAVYLSWFEDFRIHYLGAMQVTDYSPEGPRLVLAEIGCVFRSEMLLRQDYVVTGRSSVLGTTSITMEYGVWRLGPEAPALAATGHAVIVLRTPDGSGGFPVPEPARARLLAEGAVTRDRAQKP